MFQKTVKRVIIFELREEQFAFPPDYSLYFDKHSVRSFYSFLFGILLTELAAWYVRCVHAPSKLEGVHHLYRGDNYRLNTFNFQHASL